MKYLLLLPLLLVGSFAHAACTDEEAEKYLELKNSKAQEQFLATHKVSVIDAETALKARIAVLEAEKEG